MATETGDDIARLRAVLTDCCQALSALTPEQFLKTFDGELPPEASGEPPSADAPLFSNQGTVSTVDAIVEGDAGPRWQPLLVGLPPGIEQLVGIIKPPLQILVTLLQVIATLLQVLAAILLGIADPLRALIMAAYEAIRNIINDIINTGAYLYYDAPGITSSDVTAADLGFSFSPKTTFEAGFKGKQIPQITPSAWEKWSARFVASFDDPGDTHRPSFSDGAAIQALFIMVAAPNLEALRQLLFLIGSLFNVTPFVRAWEQFQRGPAPLRRRVRGRSVPPDWRSVSLKTLFPQAMRALARVPEQLLGLLKQVDNLVSLIKNVADALTEKARILQELAAVVQSVIDLLDALSSTGMYFLSVSTGEGQAGLKKAFDTAANRPPGAYVGGVCLLLGGPGLSDGAFLWDMLVGGGAGETLKNAWVGDEQNPGLFPTAGDVVDEAGEKLKKSASEHWDEMKAAVENFPEDVEASAGRRRDEFVEALHVTPEEFAEWVEDLDEAYARGAIERGLERSRTIRRRSERSITAYLGRPGTAATPPKPPTVDDEDLT